jgi:N-acetyl-gamma-glutamylphosphate reductase
MIDLATARDPTLLALLRNHPRVARVEEGGTGALVFHLGAWVREVRIGDEDSEQYGLIELADNNPIVCADVVSVPSPVATLALIALGPLAAAGIIREVPTVISSIQAGDDTDDCLKSVGWKDGVIVSTREYDLDGVVIATAMAEIATPESLEEIDELYDERFGKSFFVRRDEESEWRPELVRGLPFATYRLRITPDEPVSLLTIHVLGGLAGKCGAAQVVHAMNVMSGLEESLGLA